MHRFGRSFVLTALAALVLLGLATSSASAAGTASIAGTVSVAAEPDQVQVCAYRDDRAEPIACANPSNLNAEYEVTGLSAGTYFVSFRSNGCSNACRYVPQWYEGTLRRADAKPIVLSDGEEETGIDASMAETGTIEGTVLNASDEQPATGFEACAFRPGQSHAASCSENPSAGEYQIGGLTPGRRYVVQSGRKANAPPVAARGKTGTRSTTRVSRTAPKRRWSKRTPPESIPLWSRVRRSPATSPKQRAARRSTRNRYGSAPTPSATKMGAGPAVWSARAATTRSRGSRAVKA